jgi:hypothetical protein
LKILRIYRFLFYSKSAVYPKQTNSQFFIFEKKICFEDFAIDGHFHSKWQYSFHTNGKRMAILLQICLFKKMSFLKEYHKCVECVEYLKNVLNCIKWMLNRHIFDFFFDR